MRRIRRIARFLLTQLLWKPCPPCNERACFLCGEKRRTYIYVQAADAKSLGVLALQMI